MAEEKCFCHLNGYAVKDATARAQIAELQKSGGSVDLSPIETRLTELEADLAEFADANGQAHAVYNYEIEQLTTNNTALTNKITALETLLADAVTRITALEAAAVSLYDGSVEVS